MRRCRSVSGGCWRGGILLLAALAVLVPAGGCGADDDIVPATTSAAGSGGVGLQQPGGGGTGGGGGDGGTIAPPSCGPLWPDSPTVLCAGEDALFDSCPQEGEWGYGQDGSYVVRTPGLGSGSAAGSGSATEGVTVRVNNFKQLRSAPAPWTASSG